MVTAVKSYVQIPMGPLPFPFEPPLPCAVHWSTRPLLHMPRTIPIPLGDVLTESQRLPEAVQFVTVMFWLEKLVPSYVPPQKAMPVSLLPWALTLLTVTLVKPSTLVSPPTMTPNSKPLISQLSTRM